MSFEDDSRLVVKEGQPPPPFPSSRPASSKGEKRKSTATHAAPAPPTRHGGGRKPDGFGTVTCVHTFPTGLVVSTGSDGTVSLWRRGGGAAVPWKLEARKRSLTVERAVAGGFGESHCLTTSSPSLTSRASFLAQHRIYMVLHEIMSRSECVRCQSTDKTSDE